MGNYMPYIWIAVIVISVIAEAASTALIAIWFMPSALITMVISFFKVIFLLLSVLFIIFSRTIFRHTLRARPVPTNADALIGEVAVVTEKISNIEACGLVKIRGQIWSAKSADGVDIDKDEKVSIISIEGVKLVCRKTENN